MKPLVGKVISRYDGETDFTGHNARIVSKTNEDGNEYKDIEFDTSAFGTFYSASIETIEGVNYIVANAKIWKRFSQAYEVIKRRVNANIGIKTSWEVQVLEAHYEMVNGKNTKIIDNGIFIGHALLGESVSPAYPCSGLLQVSSLETTDVELANALVNDLDISFDNVKKEELEVTKKELESSSLTTRDLHQKILETINPKGWNSNPYYCIWEVYPEERKVLAYDIDRDSEDNYLVFTYSVSNESVTVDEPSTTKLSKLISEKSNVNINIDLNKTAEILSQKEMDIKNLISEKEKLISDLAENVDALIQAGTQIEQLQYSVQELIPYREQVEENNRIETEKEIANKKLLLKQIAIKGGFITSEELETSEELSALIESLDEKSIKAIIAERLIAKLDIDKANVETSESKKVTVIAKQNIESDDDNLIDHKSVMSSFLKNN
ncbi:hypothetical protein [Paenibacillus pini]|uniref:Uncharacterized protein n=1 Tax=Paenibacillus pini JCM 16418 TaxID=1236976 RepID=W7YIW5_9BACL|nr:hypothetical protein [Paenibacillus pini]GAF10845.1 hypothetical protein JCM16418_5070 [Paenibacillus pini JCM 16418]